MNQIYSWSIFIICLSAFSCYHKLSSEDSALNRESIDIHGNQMLIGKCTRERLKEKPYGDWFNKNYADYKIDTVTAEKLKTYLSQKNFLIFMGTWCGDSKREVPRIFKILDYCGVKSGNIKLIMMDSRDSVYKQSPTHEERGLNIHRVPDLLIYSNNKEMGRIVESPVVTLEKDMLAITSGETYTSNYKIVPFLVTQFQQKNIRDIQNNLPDIANEVKPWMYHFAELNSYGHVLMAAGEMDKAAVSFRLNALLYPENAGVFASLGAYYLKTGNKLLAKENCEKALKIQPDNERAKKISDQLQNN
ncbi:MAG TPA: thioredoxin family protein [Puia sp.]|nr:thioredoxin family protein [Puia sp.]